MPRAAVAAAVAALLCAALPLCPARAAAAGESEALRALDAHFAERDTPAREQALETALVAALRERPDSVEHLLRLARLRAWQADAAPDKEAKRRLGREGWELGDRVAQLAPGRAEGYYYAAASLASYGDGVGVLAALSQGLEGQFLQRVRRAVELDPWLDAGGPQVALGRYHYTMPWPKRDLRRARALYTGVLARHPDNLRARYYLAQLALREKAEAEAQGLLTGVLQAPPGPNPPEERRIKGWAARVQREAQLAKR
jgi:cytochrome c-type biogenesis protein CcmH/NrfG